MPAGSDLQEQLHSRIQEGTSLISSLKSPSVKSVHGIPKLEKKIRQEVKFLEKFVNSKKDLKKEHLHCSNLSHLSAIVQVLFKSNDPTTVFQPFSLETKDGELKKVNVDVVCDGGYTWLKVIARNPKALDLNSVGGNQFGQRSIVDQVKEFVLAAKQNPVLFHVPKVVFVFHNGISSQLAQRLERKGVSIQGEIIAFENDNVVSSEEEESEDEDSGHEASEEESGEEHEFENDVDTSTLNLDITAMIAYISALTNGHAKFRFKEHILSDQAMWERQRPVKPVLDQLFSGKRLICCQSAMTDFENILSTLGGPEERIRAVELVDRVEVVPDQMSDRVRMLDLSGKIKERSRTIFGTGDNLRVVTISANSGFLRAAKGQGVPLAVIPHESRALTESKMANAELIQEVED